jgi:hypothetical protein
MTSLGTSQQARLAFLVWINWKRISSLGRLFYCRIAEALFLDTNKLNGQIPNCFGHLTQLRQLYLFQNQLTGTVPNDLQSLSRLCK